MSQTLVKYLHNAAVLYNDDQPWRWFDAFGPNVCKHVTHFESLAMEAANNPGEWTATLVNASTVALAAGTRGGELLITTAGADNDGVNMQIVGESYSFEGQYPLYFGMRFKVTEATQSDFLVGMCITDTDLVTAVTDGVYFRKIDGSTVVNFVLEKDNLESTTSVDVCVADAWVTYEFYYDGFTISAYVDDVLLATFDAASATNMPDDEELTPSIHFLTGDNAAEIMTVDWLRVIQINE